MAETFKNAKAALGTAVTTIYTCPSATTSVIIHAQVVNTAGSALLTDVYWTDASDAGGTAYLAENVSIPAGAAYEPIGGKLVLEAGDALIATGEVASQLQASIAFVEFT